MCMVRYGMVSHCMIFYMMYDHQSLTPGHVVPGTAERLETVVCLLLENVIKYNSVIASNVSISLTKLPKLYYTLGLPAIEYSRLSRESAVEYSSTKLGPSPKYAL